MLFYVVELLYVVFVWLRVCVGSGGFLSFWLLLRSLREKPGTEAFANESEFPVGRVGLSLLFSGFAVVSR